MRIILLAAIFGAACGGGSSLRDADADGIGDDVLDAPIDSPIDASTVDAAPYDPAPWGAACLRPDYGAVSCLGKDGTIGWCVEHGFYTYTGNTVVWTTTRPDSCELACTPPSDTCPGDLPPRYDRNSECYCSPTL